MTYYRTLGKGLNGGLQRSALLILTVLREG